LSAPDLVSGGEKTLGEIQEIKDKTVSTINKHNNALFKYSPPFAI